MLCIETQNLLVKIKEKGAELCSIYDKERDREVLWQGDRRVWAEQSPLLFPFIGRLEESRYTYNDEQFSMTLHGFARDNVFRVVESNADSCILELRDTALSRESYPFFFRLRQSYKVEGKSLFIETRVENLGVETLYFALGLHPGFQFFGKEDQISDYLVEFPLAEKEKLEQVLFSEKGLVEEKRGSRALWKKGIALSEELFLHDAPVFPETGGKVLFHRKGDEHGISVEYPDYRYLGLWQPYGKDAAFLCVEPWTSLPGRDGILEDIGEKKDMQQLYPEKEKTYSVKISLY